MHDTEEELRGASMLRTWYDAFFKLAGETARARVAVELDTQPERGPWGCLDATGNILSNVMVSDEKCRIVIDYDPAGEKVKIRQERA